LISLLGTEAQKRVEVKEQSTGMVATDYWKSYNEMIPAQKLLQTKATVESHNGQIRHFLARFMAKRNLYKFTNSS